MIKAVPIGSDPTTRPMPNGVDVARDGNRIYLTNTGTTRSGSSAPTPSSYYPIPLGSGADPVDLAVTPNGDPHSRQRLGPAVDLRESEPTGDER